MRWIKDGIVFGELVAWLLELDGDGRRLFCASTLQY